MKFKLAKIPDSELDSTNELFKELKSIKKQGYLTKPQLIKILFWKSPRPLNSYELNSAKFIKDVTRLSFATKDETLKIHILTALHGVNFPAASAILMFYDKKSYPVLDIRVWQQLYKAKLVTENPKGQNFRLRQWQVYLDVIRHLAKEHTITARQVEKRIFDHDVKTRRGKLYNAIAPKK